MMTVIYFMSKFQSLKQYLHDFEIHGKSLEWNDDSIIMISTHLILLDNLYTSHTSSPSSSGNGHKVYSKIHNLKIFSNSVKINLLITHFLQYE